MSVRHVSPASAFIGSTAFLLISACNDDGSPPPPPPPPPVECTQVAISDLQAADHETGYTLYASTVSVDGAAPDQLRLEFYEIDGRAPAGSYALNADVNANYATCAECVLVYSDINQQSGAPTKIYFQSAGSITLNQNPHKMQLKASLTGVKLIEVDIDTDNNFTSTPIPNGGCIELVDNTAIDVVAWTCEPEQFEGDNGCDCECGIIDFDCFDREQVVEGCEASETCNIGGCVASCSVFAPTQGCATGTTCVPGNVIGTSFTDYCTPDTDEGIDPATIGTDCSDTDPTFVCAVDNGIATGACIVDDPEAPEAWECLPICRVGGTDCTAPGAECVPVFEPAVAGDIGGCRVPT